MLGQSTPPYISDVSLACPAPALGRTHQCLVNLDPRYAGPATLAAPEPEPACTPPGHRGSRLLRADGGAATPAFCPCRQWNSPSQVHAAPGLLLPWRPEETQGHPGSPPQARKGAPYSRPTAPASAHPCTQGKIRSPQPSLTTGPCDLSPAPLPGLLSLPGPTRSSPGGLGVLALAVSSALDPVPPNLSINVTFLLPELKPPLVL